MSYRGWLVIVILFALLFYGGIFLIRTSYFYGETDRPCIDIENEGIPKFINTYFTEIDKIEYIERFRSGYGWNCPDDFESCRIMAHNYVPFDEYTDDKEIKIFSPINGTIIEIWQIYINSSGSWQPVEEDSATYIIIKSTEYPAFKIKINIIDIRNMGLQKGMKVYAGQHLGYACTRYANTVTKLRSFGIIISVNICPSGEMKVSYFDVMADKIFADYEARVASSREQFIISKEDRDMDPLNCVIVPNVGYLGESFIYEKGNLPDWVYFGKDPSDFKIVYEI